MMIRFVFGVWTLVRLDSEVLLEFVGDADGAESRKGWMHE